MLTDHRKSKNVKKIKSSQRLILLDWSQVASKRVYLKEINYFNSVPDYLTSDLLQRGDSSAPFGQSGVLSHTVVRLMHTLWPGHCHCQLGHLKGGVGQSRSSLMSLQSLSPSQIQLRNTQFPLSQRKRVEGQVRGGQAWCSSLPSAQSGWPSHSQVDGTQLPSDWHWNSLSWWHIPGGRVADMHSEIPENVSTPCSRFSKWQTI